jgi:uncharacterized protein (DUF488 family)
MTEEVLHTIGYEGSSIDDLVETLLRVGVDLLIDVREVPISRKRGFSKRLLADRLADHDIDYLHLKGLGDPKPGRQAARERRYRDFQRIFLAHLRSEAAELDLRKGIEAARGRCACLLCFEKDHEHCHRDMVASRMADLDGFTLVHLQVGDE